MGRIKDKKQSHKIDGKATSNQGCCSEQYPWFSFRAMTKNANYNLKKLSSGPDREITLLGLYKKLEELSSKSWRYWIQQPKTSGFETLPYDELFFKPNEEVLKITKDTNLFIFRFDTYLGNGKGRIIGYKESPCSVLHIIGYDIDFSAYDHGS